MNNKDFINAMATHTDLPTKTIQKLTTSIINHLAEKLDDETTLSIQGFGSFEVKKKTERIMVNPISKQRRLIPPKLVLTFKPSTVLKEKMQ